MPYGLAAAVILLLMIFSQYITLRMENGHLRKQIDDHIKSASASVRDLESKLDDKSSLYSTCIKSNDKCDFNLEKIRAKVAEQEKTITDTKKELEDAAKRNADLQDEVKRVIAEKYALEESENKYKKDKEDLEKQVSEMKDLEEKRKEKASEEKIENTTKGKRPSLTFEKDDEDPGVKIDTKQEDHGGEAKSNNELDNNQPPSKQEILSAELPDVDPAKVKVKNNDMTGNTYHKDKNGRFLPIIVNDDPRAKRAKPEHSVLEDTEKKKRQ